MPDKAPPPARCVIYTPGGLGTPKQPFGKDVANIGLYRALAHHGGFEELCFLVHNQTDPTALAHALELGPYPKVAVTSASVLTVGAAQRCGTVFRGKADLTDLAWLRQRHRADRDYSLVGLVHSVAAPAIRQYVAQASTSPVQPWDALVCTSPVVRDALRAMFEQWGDFLAFRFGAPRDTARPMPELPVLPLGVEAAAFSTAADDGEARRLVRDRLALGPDDILVLWVGRLSFFEKAFPQPMFQAVQDAAQRSGKRLQLAMAGWFPNGAEDRTRYEAAARVHAPSIPVHFLDGTDKRLVSELWAGADIFLSLVDNIQETFGITPIEAMAAGLPVVASDWDGYRATIQHGVQGFLIETLGGPPGLGDLMLDRHLFGMTSYQTYVGQVAQHTAVHVGRAGEAIAALATDKKLRERMGAAGRERVRTTFDWPVVARQYGELMAELADKRRSSASFGSDLEGGRRGDPVRSEPFATFRAFPTEVLKSSTRLYPGSSASVSRLQEIAAVELNAFGSQWRASAAEAEAVQRLVGERPGITAGQILEFVSVERRKQLTATLMWLAKLGFVMWERSSNLDTSPVERFEPRPPESLAP